MPARRNLVLSVIVRVLVAGGVLALALGVAAWLVSTRPRPVVTRPADVAPRVLVMQAHAVPVRRQWEGFGTARALDAADVPARVTATVIERLPEMQPGRGVQRGELLLALDDSDFQRRAEIASRALEDLDAQLERLQVEEESWKRRTALLENELRLAEAELERVRTALAAGVAKQREADVAEQAAAAVNRVLVAAREEFDKVPARRASLLAQRHSQDATLRLARQDLERTRIVSPLEGVLQSVDVEEGENVTAGQRVARVVSLRRIEIPLLLPASARAHVAVGDTVTVTVPGAEPRPYPGVLARIAPEDDPSTRTMQVFIEIEQDTATPPVIAPGRFVQGVVASSDERPRWVVPRRAVDGQRVLLVEDGLVRAREVELDFEIDAQLPALGLPDRQWTVLREPLPEGALVVVDASRTLAEGSPVRPEPAAAPAAARAAPPSPHSGSSP